MIEIVTAEGVRRPGTNRSRKPRARSNRKSMTSPATRTRVGAVLLVRVLVDKNPKKLKAAERFAKYEDGMPVTRYAELVGDRAQAYRDLVWDEEMGFIELVPSDEVDACGADEAAREGDVALDLGQGEVRHTVGGLPDVAQA